MATSPFRLPSDTEVSDEDNHPDHKQWWEQEAPTRPKRGKKKKSPPCPWGEQGPIVTNPVPNLPGGGDLPSEAYWAKAAKDEAKQEAAIARWEEKQAQRALKKRRRRQEEEQREANGRAFREEQRKRDQRERLAAWNAAKAAAPAPPPPPME